MTDEAISSDQFIDFQMTLVVRSSKHACVLDTLRLGIVLSRATHIVWIVPGSRLGLRLSLVRGQTKSNAELSIDATACRVALVRGVWLT